MTDVELYRKSQQELKQYGLTVAKQNVAIQKARYSLSTQQQKILCYLISELKSTDTRDTEKVFRIKDFFAFMEINCKRYERVADNVKALSNKSWWVSINKDEQVLLRFLNTVKTNKRTGTLTIKFHEDMLPYLQELNVQNPYTRYKLFYVMTMKSQYSMRIYEMLKSVEKLGTWSFSIEQLQKQLCCENYSRFPDFRRVVIEVAMAEINDKTDLNVSYEFIKTGRAYTDIEFYVSLKDPKERLQIDKKIRNGLDNPQDEIKASRLDSIR